MHDFEEQQQKAKITRQIRNELRDIELESKARQELSPDSPQIRFSEGFADDLAEMLLKGPEESERDARESEQRLLEYLEDLHACGISCVEVFADGILYAEGVAPSELENLPLSFRDAHYLCSEGNWYFKASWTDVHLKLSPQAQPWVCIVQTQDSHSAHVEFDRECSSAALKEAEEKGDEEQITQCRERLANVERDSADGIRCVTLPPNHIYLTGQGVVEGVKIWFERHFPKFREIEIKLVPQEDIEPGQSVSAD